MKILDCHVFDFASYKELKFNFDKQGLTLIHGPTGAGKSTLCDVIPWILWGRTAKDGAVDEIISWTNNMPATGVANVEVKQDRFDVVRTRGRSSKDNDLYIIEQNGNPIRGKDMLETQKLINTRLGIDFELYLASAYFHEFSQTAGFFSTTAKNRRLLCEQIADLSMAKKLAINLSTYNKRINELMDKANSNIMLLTGTKQTLEKTLSVLEVQRLGLAEKFENQRQEKINEIEQVIQLLNEKLQTVNNEIYGYTSLISEHPEVRCSECGALKSSSSRIEWEKQLKKWEQEKIQVKAQLDIQQKQVKSQKNLINPHKANKQGQVEIKADLDKTINDLTNWQMRRNEYLNEKFDIDSLSGVVSTFRGAVVSNTIVRIQHYTNELLSKYFDGEIQVLFEVMNDDKLDVSISKDGNQCSYTQLSKGQRGVLKLCFGVAVMRSAAEFSGTKFNAIFFDEALDGLSEYLKTKAYGLFQSLELEYDSILVVDHSESLKAIFNKKIEVSLKNGNSLIEQA